MDDPIRWIRAEIRKIKSKIVCKEEQLDLLQNEITSLKRELQNLEIASEVLERRYKLPLFRKQIEAEENTFAESNESPIPATENPAPKRPDNQGTDLSGSNIKDAAIKILSENYGEWLDYREVADHAIRYGYQSTKTGSTEASVTRSFLDIMRKMTELERDKKRFRLTQSNTNGRH